MVIPSSPSPSPSSSSYPVLCASFNQDSSCFAIATRDGFKIFDTTTGRLCYERGICAFSPSLDGCFLALPASTVKGSVLVYNVMELHLHCEIDAHRSPLAAVVLSSNGKYIATASEQGTIIRVHLVSDASKSYSFRRGTYPSTIFSLSFVPSVELPEILVATSSSGSVHAFSLGFAINQRSRRLSSFLGSMIPGSVNDALDPAHHHVLHNAFPAATKSYAVIRKVETVADSSMPESMACRATVSIITYCGYFLEYILNINHQKEASWVLDRELNLLTAISGSSTTNS